MTAGTPPSPARRRLFAALTALVAVVLTLGAAEGALRLWSTLAPRHREPVLDYGDTWRRDGLGPGGFLRPDLDVRVADGYGGTVRWTTNAQGFRNDRSVTPRPRPDTLRILSLGDSFTAGYRVDQEATFSHLLERWLQGRDGVADAEVLVAAIEDPVTGLFYLDQYGFDFEPRIVLLGLTLGNDVAQAWANLHPLGPYRLTGEPPEIVENPESRPDEIRRLAGQPGIPAACQRRPGEPPAAPTSGDGTGGWRLGEWIRSSWRARYLAEAPQTVVSTWNAYRDPRLLDSNGLGIFLQEPPPIIEESYRRLFRTLTAYRHATAARGVVLVVAFYPQRYQVQPQDWEKTVEVYGLEPSCFDLELPNRRLAELTERQVLRLIDPTKAMARAYQEGGSSLYLPGGDMHWNPRGHRAFFAAARPVFEELLAELERSSSTSE